MSKPEYINGIAISVNNDSGEATMRLFNEWPDYDFKKQSTEYIVENIAICQMSLSTLKMLRDQLSAAIDRYNDQRKSE